MIFQAMEVGSYLSNCYIVGSNTTKEAAIIDPGGSFGKIEKGLNELNLIPKIIILTHGHGDHIAAVNDFIEKYQTKVYVHKDDAEMIMDANLNLSRYVTGKNISITPDVLLNDGDIVSLGDLNFEIIHTPGHTRGGICIKIENIMFTGDTLFNKSIGRTDFEGGSFDEIISSITNKIFSYDENTVIYPGHNSPSTIKSEKIGNPFVN